MSMAGYSGRSVVQKLGLKPGFRIFVEGLSVPYSDIVGELPAELRVMKAAKAQLDAVHLFATSSTGLAAKLSAYRKAIAPAGMIWVSWPKKASKMPTDVTEDIIRAEALKRDLVDVKVAAIDETWSGLKLVIRKERRH